MSTLPARSSRHALTGVDILSAHPLFGKLPPAVLARLGSFVTKRRAKRGATIFRKGDAGTGLMAVVSGNVKISVPGLDGREAVLNVIQPGDIFGEIALLDGRPRTADATAMSDCELLVIDRRDVLPLIRNDPDLALQIIDVLCARLRRTSQHIEDVMFLNLPSRLAKTLLQLRAEAASQSRARIAVTQREIGQMIGMSRESTNKQLRAWTKEKLVRLERGGIVVLNSDALAEIAAGLDDSDLDAA